LDHQKKFLRSCPFSLDPIEAFLEKLLAEQGEDKVTLPDDALRNGKDED